jgi:hypothetical protein
MPSFSNVFLMSAGDVVPGLPLAVRRLHEVVDLVVVELAELAAPERRRLRPEDVERLEAESRIHWGSSFISEICSTVCRVRPLPLLNE